MFRTLFSSSWYCWLAIWKSAVVARHRRAATRGQRHRNVQPAARRRGRFRPRFEALESRLTPSNHTWTGNNWAFAGWSEQDNWVENEGPPRGDPDAILEFTDVGQHYHENSDDYDGALPLKAIFFSSGEPYVLDADTGSVTVSDFIQMIGANEVTLTNTIALDIELTNNLHTFDVEGHEATLSISGRISGEPGLLLKSGNGTLQLSGDNRAYLSSIDVAEGTLKVGGVNSLRIGQSIGVGEGGILDLNNFDETLDVTGMDGGLLLGSGTLTVRGGITDVRGTIQGSGGLTLTNNARLTLEGTEEAYDGPTRVLSGTLEVDADSPFSPVTLERNTRLAGRGVTGPLMVSGIVEPGNVPGEGGIGPGVLHSGDATFLAGSTFGARLDGPDPGGQHGYDQLDVDGRLDLTGNPTLDVSLNFAPTDGETFTIIRATGGVTGTFAGLPDNADFGVFGGQEFRINYTADGVVLTRRHQLNPPVASPAGFGPVSQAVGDFDGDGTPDLVVVSGISTQGPVSFLKGRGDGTFADPNTVFIGGQLEHVVAAPLRNNEPLDLVVSVSGDGLRVLLGNGDGTFEPPQPYFQGREVVGVALGHFRGPDQPLDLAVLSQGDGHVYIFLGNGDGTFADPTPFDLTDTKPHSIAIGDVNGDGKLDIVVSHSNVPSTVDVLLGNGDGTFQPSQHITGVGSGQAGTALADLRGNGHLDIVISNDGGSVTVLLGNGDGTFQSPRSLPVGPSVFDVQVADFDHDGKLDIIAQNSNGFAILYGNGDGTFRGPVQYDIAGSMRQMQVADFNGDGYPDLSVLLYSGSVDVFVNAGSGTPAPRGAGAPGTRLPMSVGLAVEYLHFADGVDRSVPAPSSVGPEPTRPPCLETWRIDQSFKAMARERLLPGAWLLDRDDLTAAWNWWEEDWFAERWLTGPAL